MVCLGFKPGAAEWKEQTNPLSYGGIPYYHTFICDLCCSNFMLQWHTLPDNTWRQSKTLLLQSLYSLCLPLLRIDCTVNIYYFHPILSNYKMATLQILVSWLWAEVSNFQLYLQSWQWKNYEPLPASVTRLGDLLHFGQLFKACGNN